LLCLLQGRVSISFTQGPTSLTAGSTYYTNITIASTFAVDVTNVVISWNSEGSTNYQYLVTGANWPSDVALINWFFTGLWEVQVPLVSANSARSFEVGFVVGNPGTLTITAATSASINGNSVEVFGASYRTSVLTVVSRTPATASN
jgi:hypothetical protein